MKYIVVLTISFLCAMAFPVNSEEKPFLPQETTTDNGTYALCGEELIVKALFFDVLHIGIYRQDCSTFNNIYENVDQIVRFHYLVDVEKKDFIDGAIEYIEYNISEDIQTECKSHYQPFNQSYLDVTENDFYDLEYRKDQGLKLWLNQNTISIMENPKCSRNYYKIWFGEESMDSAFKELESKISNLKK